MEMWGDCSLSWHSPSVGPLGPRLSDLNVRYEYRLLFQMVSHSLPDRKVLDHLHA